MGEGFSIDVSLTGFHLGKRFSELSQKSEHSGHQKSCKSKRYQAGMRGVWRMDVGSCGMDVGIMIGERIENFAFCVAKVLIPMQSILIFRFWLGW